MSDETLIAPDDPLDDDSCAPTPDRDLPDDHPGQESADLKEDPKSPKSPKKTPARKRFRLEQDPGGPVEAPGASPPLNDEAPMNALSPDRTKKATTTKSTGTKTASPKSVTKPEVQRHHNLSATVVRGPKVEHGIVRWYWRVDRCTSAALGVTERETIYHKWATVTEVQTELADLVIRGAHRPQKAFSGQRIITFADLIKADEAAQGEPAHLSPATLANRTARRRWLTKLLGHKAIVQTSTDELERIFVGTKTAGRAHVSVKKEVEFILRAWQWAFEERIVAVKPPPRIDLGSVNREPQPTPTRSQVNAIIQALDGEARLIVEVLASTGARIGEVISLRRCDYDTHTHWLTVNGKTGTRRIPVDETLREVLASRADGTTESLFNWGHKSTIATKKAKWLRHALARACRRLGLVESFTPHSFRRAAVNFFIDHGFDPKLVAVLLGHSVNVAMEYYRTPTPEQIERMVMAARPGDFSETSSARRLALDTLSHLLKDEALMADDHARDAVTLLLNSLGKAIGVKGEQSAGPAEQDEATPQAVHGDPRPARPSAMSTPASEHRGPRAAAPAQRGDTRTPAPAQPPARAAVPVAAVAPRAVAPLSGKGVPSPAPPPHPSARQRDSAAPPPRQLTTPHRISPAKPQLQSRPSPELEARHQPRRRPPLALTDKLAKG